jgi:hypothetical protein
MGFVPTGYWYTYKSKCGTKHTTGVANVEWLNRDGHGVSRLVHNRVEVKPLPRKAHLVQELGVSFERRSGIDLTTP